MLEPSNDDQALHHRKTQVLQITLLHQALGIGHERIGYFSTRHGRRVCRRRKEGAIQQLQRRVIVGEQIRKVEPDGIDKLVEAVDVVEEVRLEVLLQAQVGGYLREERLGRQRRLGRR